MNNPNVAFMQGNGGLTAEDLWYPEVMREIEQLGIEVIAEHVPPYVVDSMTDCMQYMKDVMKIGKDTIVVGHSSGAQAAMRFAESNPVYGSVLVAACHSDLGMASEKQSGYYTEPWDWAAIKSNQNWIAQFAAPNDPYISIEEPRYIHSQLGTDYYELTRGHYQEITFPEVAAVIKSKLGI